MAYITQLQHIGSGSFGICHLAQVHGVKDLSAPYYAVKHMNKISTTEKGDVMEWKTNVYHHNVLHEITAAAGQDCTYTEANARGLLYRPMFYAVEEETEGVKLTGQKMAVVMQAGTMDCKTAMDKKPFGYAERAALWQGMLKAVYTLHTVGTRHGDIKLPNLIIMPDRSVALSDLGMSYFDMGEDDKHCEICTADTRAPEIWFKRPHGLASDIWSMGIVMLAAMTGVTIGPLRGVGLKTLKRDGTWVYNDAPYLHEGKMQSVMPYGIQLNYVGEVFASMPDMEDLPLAAAWLNIDMKCVMPEELLLLRYCLQVDPKKRKTAEELIKLVVYPSGYKMSTLPPLVGGVPSSRIELTPMKTLLGESFVMATDLPDLPRVRDLYLENQRRWWQLLLLRLCHGFKSKKASTYIIALDILFHVGTCRRTVDNMRTVWNNGMKNVAAAFAAEKLEIEYVDLGNRNVADKVMLVLCLYTAMLLTQSAAHMYEYVDASKSRRSLYSLLNSVLPNTGWEDGLYRRFLQQGERICSHLFFSLLATKKYDFSSTDNMWPYIVLSGKSKDFAFLRGMMNTIGTWNYNQTDFRSMLAMSVSFSGRPDWIRNSHVCQQLPPEKVEEFYTWYEELFPLTAMEVD